MKQTKKELLILTYNFTNNESGIETRNARIAAKDASVVLLARYSPPIVLKKERRVTK